MNNESGLPNNTEINEALKKFNATSQTEQTQKNEGGLKDKLGDICFETDSYKVTNFHKEINTPWMIKTTIKLSCGSIKDQRQAEWALFVFVILSTAISLYFLFGTIANNNMEVSKYSLPPGQFIPK